MDNAIYKTEIRPNTEKPQDSTIEKMHLFIHVLTWVLLAKPPPPQKKDSYKDLRSSGDHKLQFSYIKD